MSFIHGDEKPEQRAEAVARGDALQPGVYPFDIYVNLTQVDHKDVTFVRLKGRAASQPCLKVEDLRNYGIKLPETLQAGSCADLPALIKDATVSYDAAVQQINISVPQTMMDQGAIGAIPPSMYDEGINALFANITSTTTRTAIAEMMPTTAYMFLANSGLNSGQMAPAQQLHTTKQSGSSSWTNVSSGRDRHRAMAQPFGDGAGEHQQQRVQQLPVPRVQLSSVDDMLPDSLRGYAGGARRGGNQRPRRNSPERLRHLQHQRRAGSFRDPRRLSAYQQR